MSQGAEILGGESEGFEERPDGAEASGGAAHDAGSEVESYDSKETAKDSLERFLGDKKTEADGDTQADPLHGDKGETPEEKPDPLEAKDPKADEFDPELLPPERFNERAKKAFINAPKGVRREIHRALRDMEAGFSRVAQQAQETIKEWQPLREEIAPYARKWASMGVGMKAGILQLAAMQEQLTNPDDAAREDAFLKLSQRSKVDVVKMARRILGQGADQQGIPDLAHHPLAQQISPLQTELANLKSEIQAERLQREIQPLLSEMEAVRNEVDPASGHWKYPLLQNEATLNSVKTLVPELVANTPGLSYPEALKKAHNIRMREILGNGYQASPTRTAAPNGHSQRALSAGFSVRGRPAPTSGALEPEMPSDAKRDAKASLEWFMRG